MIKRVALLVALLIIAFVLLSLEAGFDVAVTGTRIAGEIAAQMLALIH